jgi:hypothetical protein
VRGAPHADVGEIRKDAPTSRSGAALAFTTGEFGRLVSVIKDERVCRAVFDSGLRLNRRQLDAKHDSDQVWSDTVLPLFIDPHFRPSAFLPLLMLQRFKDPNVLDFGKIPEREVTAPQLRKCFYDMRGEFSKCYSRWSRSGQNEAENFPDFCAFGRDGYLTAVGERCCIMAAAFEVGTSTENTDLLNFTVRLCESGAETDLEGKGWFPVSDKASGVSSQKRKRKHSSLGEESSDQTLADQVSACLRPVISLFKSSIESAPAEGRNDELSLNERRRMAMITLREAYATLEKVPESARSVVQGQIDNILAELSQIGV